MNERQNKFRNEPKRYEKLKGREVQTDSAEKPLRMLRPAQHERKISHDFNHSSVRPEALEG
jgi:hypothetical protein